MDMDISLVCLSVSSLNSKVPVQITTVHPYIHSFRGKVHIYYETIHFSDVIDQFMFRRGL